MESLLLEMQLLEIAASKGEDALQTQKAWREGLRSKCTSEEETRFLRQALAIHKKAAEAKPTQPTPTRSQTLLEKYEQLIGNTLNQKERTILLSRFSSFLLPIEAGSLSIPEGKKLLRSIRTILRSETIRRMISEGYVFDELLGPTAGAGRAVLYRVLCTSSFQVFCGKVYLKDSEGTTPAEKEIWASQVVHSGSKHPYIVQYIPVEISHEGHDYSSMALLMPLYAMSLSDIIEAYRGIALPFEKVKNISQGLLSAGARFEETKLAHCDIKPENVMMDGASAVVIDLGSVTKFGGRVEEFTRFYALDASYDAVEAIFDLNCIVVTLCRCFATEVSLPKASSRAALAGEIEALRGTALAASAAHCLRMLDPECRSCAAAMAAAAMRASTSSSESA